MGEIMNFFQAFPTSMKMLEQISEAPRDGLLKSHLLVLGARYRKSACFGPFRGVARIGTQVVTFARRAIVLR